MSSSSSSSPSRSRSGSSNGDERPRFFDKKAKNMCWAKAEIVPGRHPERWRKDAAGNIVCKRFCNCNGCLCFEYDHIVPFSKGPSISYPILLFFSLFFPSGFLVLWLISIFCHLGIFVFAFLWVFLDDLVWFWFGFGFWSVVKIWTWVLSSEENGRSWN